MSDADRKDAAPLVLLAAGVACVWLASRLPVWAQTLAHAAGRPATVTLVSALATFAGCLLAVRLVVTRRALRRRVRIALVPADSFDPSPDAVVSFAAGLSRSRRAIRGLFGTPASAVRIRLDHDDRGWLRYMVELPAHARLALGTAASAYGAAVELRADPTTGEASTEAREEPR